MSLSLSGVARRFGDRSVFQNVDFELSRGERVALIGENGSGKSTLLRVLAGLDAPDAGHVTRGGSVNLLAQEASLPGESLALAVTPPALRAAAAAFQVAGEALADPSDANLMAFAQAEERFRALGGYDFEARAAAVLRGLRLDPGARADRLSGGQTRRAMLARLLLSPADFLLLDEPTNHLDAQSVAWLESWLRDHPGGMLVVSHDRAFLDAVVTRVYELERGALRAYPGNYSEATRVKAELQAAQEREYEAHRRQHRALEGEMHHLRSKGESAGRFNRKRAGNTSLMAAKNKAESASRAYAGRAKALEKRLERLEADAVPKPYEDRTRVTVPLPDVTRGPSVVLRLQDVTVERGGRVLLSGVTETIRRGERVALVGPNGSGKSTLLQAALGRAPVAAGRVLPGVDLSVYWAGQHGEELAGLASLADALLDAQPALRRADLYPLLAGLGLPPDPAFPISGLSGGGRTRLSLARLAVTRAHLLVLDEPTNHLDVRAIEALEALLASYAGTVLFASHDRRLVERAATRVLRVVDGVVLEDSQRRGA